MASEEPQFDSLLGGTEELPATLSLSKFVACRSQEIQIMKNSLIAQSGSKLAFQTLARHMRRRAMSHNVKRLPRRLRQIHLNQMKKSGMPNKQKRPSRKYRRRPRNLIQEYTKRSNKKYKWLQTHIWHAKRFHMIRKWGYKIPLQPCDKAFRACYRAMTQHCLLQDLSYITCIEIVGDKNVIISSLKLVSLVNNNLSLGAKTFIDGKREGELILCENETRKVLGKINFQWCLNSKLWLWVHPAFYEEVKITLSRCFEHCSNIEMQELGTELSRFRLTGPLANAILHDALVTATFEKISTNSLLKYTSEQIIKNQHEYWCNLCNITSTSNIFPHTVLGLIVEDPRLHFPKKKQKSLPEFQNCEIYDMPMNVQESPLWDENFRKQIDQSFVSDFQMAKLQSSLLVPGALSHDPALIPVILIQSPGTKTFNIGLGSGWDIILPSCWAKTFWIAIVMRGARVGGLRETNSLLFEMGKSQFLEPDSQAGTNEQIQSLKEKETQFFKKPPNKRTNFNKFRIASPFMCNWKLLIKEWNKTNQLDGEEFIVLKDQTVLNSIDSFLNGCIKQVPDVSLNCLIPVKFVCEKRGCPSEFSIICLPKSEEDFINAVESICEDEFEAKRKELRRTHKQLLQKLKKQRKQKIKRLPDEEHSRILTEYTKQMRVLWLPEAKTIKNSCSREVIGFVTKGGFSYSLGKSFATGYIVSGCLSALMKFRNKVLFRNTNSRQYYVAKLSVILD